MSMNFHKPEPSLKISNDETKSSNLQIALPINKIQNNNFFKADTKNIS
jgi:hypothetical protein